LAAVESDMTSLTREVRFSVDRDWAGHVAGSRAVTNSWAGWPSAVGLVPYLCLRATVAGDPDRFTGLLCNVAILDDLLRRHAIPHTAEALKAYGWRISAERLLQEVWRAVAECPLPCGPMVALELCSTPSLRYAIRREKPHMVFLTQQFEFSAAHRLRAPGLSDDENRRIFGRCDNPAGHGHNYLVEVTLAGLPDERTGALVSLPRFEAIVKEHVIERLDHKHLNEDTPEFREVVPTVENLARVIFRMLEPHLRQWGLRSVRVWETAKTWAEYSQDAGD
jgi:6-pyruvoyltetrahydropterin/6-carboxytetrahydropterin synthase